MAGLLANVLMNSSAGIYPPMSRARATARRRKRSTAVRRTVRTKAARKTVSRRARLVKGSAAAKRYMASIRKKRRR